MSDIEVDPSAYERPLRLRHVTVQVPLLLPSVANLREHWATKAKRVKAQRSAAYLASRYAAWRFDLPVVVTLTRVAPRRLDSDNLASALKAVRDGVADALGVPDNHPKVGWHYAQGHGQPALLISIAEVP